MSDPVVNQPDKSNSFSRMPSCSTLILTPGIGLCKSFPIGILLLSAELWISLICNNLPINFNSFLKQHSLLQEQEIKHLCFILSQDCLVSVPHLSAHKCALQGVLGLNPQHFKGHFKVLPYYFHISMYAKLNISIIGKSIG